MLQVHWISFQNGPWPSFPSQRDEAYPQPADWERAYGKPVQRRGKGKPASNRRLNFIADKHLAAYGFKLPCRWSAVPVA
jgi:hypothetical protein